MKQLSGREYLLKYFHEAEMLRSSLQGLQDVGTKVEREEAELKSYQQTLHRICRWQEQLLSGFLSNNWPEH